MPTATMKDSSSLATPTLASLGLLLWLMFKMVSEPWFLEIGKRRESH